MDDARSRRRAERKRNSSADVGDADINKEQGREDGFPTKPRTKLSPIKESRSQRRRRRVSQDDDNGDDSESPVAQVDSVEKEVAGFGDDGQREKKRKKKSKMNKDDMTASKGVHDLNLDSTLISHIQQLSDDIVEVDEPVIMNTGGDATDGLSQPTSKVFVEFPNGFKEMGRSMMKQRGSAASYISSPGTDPPHVTTTIDIAVQCQLVTHGILSILHGVLAGIAICSCIMISYLHEPFYTEADFLHHYKGMAYCLEAIFFVLLSLCLLNALDRCDPGHSLSHFIQGVITFDATAILVILYSVALVLSLSVVNTEDKMGLLTFSNATLKVDSGELHGWWVVSICRCVVVSLAWVVFAVRPFTYSLLERLQELPGEAVAPTNNNP